MPERGRVRSPAIGLAAALVVGLLAGAAVSGRESWGVVVAGGIVGLTAGVTHLLMLTSGLSTTAAGAAAVGAATLAALLVEAVAVRDPSETVIPVVFTAVAAAALAAVCVMVVELLATERD
jgi:hypothetical protein